MFIFTSSNQNNMMRIEIQKLITKASRELTVAQTKFQKTNNTPEEMEVNRLKIIIYHLERALNQTI